MAPAAYLSIAIVVVLLSILTFPLFGLVLSAMSTIFDARLCLYAKLGTITSVFDHKLLVSSFVIKSV